MKIKNSVSFNVDHSRLKRGIYLSRIDKMGDVSTVTLDLRMRVPYKEKIISNEELHTYEHCFATAVRDITESMENVAVAYFGPMGCQTGYYLVFNVVNCDESEYYELLHGILKKSCQYVKGMKEVPAKNELQCGNCYSLGDINVAVKAANDMEVIVDEMEKQVGLLRQEYISKESIYVRNSNVKRKQGNLIPLKKEKEIDAKVFYEFAKSLENMYSNKKINEFMEKNFKNKPFINSQEIELNTTEDLILLILATIKGDKSGKSFYYIKDSNETINNNGYKIPNIKFIRRS